jgi:hypothetical protein
MTIRPVLSQAVALVLVLASAAPAAAEGWPGVKRSGDTYYARSCQAESVPGLRHCHAQVQTDVRGVPLSEAAVRAKRPPRGFGPPALRSAYQILPIQPPHAAPGPSSPVIALVAAYGYAKAESDLAVYRRQFGLPPCTTANGCFAKYNQVGVAGAYPAGRFGWSQEQALDLDMASAMCPSCRIILVQANTAFDFDLAAAVETAATKIRDAFPGVTPLGAISNSYGSDESLGGSPGLEPSYDQGVIPVLASSGDDGFGVSMPASYPTVIAVGGTTLSRSTAFARGWRETAWSGAGSGCSAIYAKPAWQTDTGCARRAVADVSAVADPATGVAVYGPTFGTTSGWLVFGGTSASTPIIAGIYGTNGVANANPLQALYASTSFYDVRFGSNGVCAVPYLCRAGVGYDGPTGLGTPRTAAPF